ncbi:hypothetical protein F443_22520 [Phytophthora nicotianae P1569]|uniref:Uncharacterized protein n=1 Tax=Phytophthora nicotianae P1569 TaxID=1317065 RepID=V9DU43_PHYNI|nr:hypothetical protein F443_22520 [Phytophthora nicotianae P1569]
MSIHSDDCVILTDDDVITDAPSSTMSLRAGSGHFPLISFLIRESQLALHHIVASFNHGKELKHQISLIAPLSAKYGDDIVAKTLVDLERKADTVPELANLVKQLRSEQLMEWLKKDKNVDEV